MKFLFLVVFLIVCAAAAEALSPSKNSTNKKVETPAKRIVRAAPPKTDSVESVATKIKNGTKRSLGKLVTPNANMTDVDLSNADGLDKAGSETKNVREARHLKAKKFARRFG